MVTSNTALYLTAFLLLTPVSISYKEGLHIIKGLVIATTRATIQLLILGLLLHHIFEINERWLSVLCVLAITVDAFWNIISHTSSAMHHVFRISFAAISVGTALPLTAAVATDVIKSTASKAIPIGGMLANNGLITINLAYQDLEEASVQDVSDIESKLMLATTPKLTSKSSIRKGIRLAIVPTIDPVRTYGLVPTPGIVIGLIVEGVDPLRAVKFQLFIVFIHTTATIISAPIAAHMSYGQFSNARRQLVARTQHSRQSS